MTAGVSARRATGLALAVVLALCGAARASGPAFGVEYLGQQVLPHGTLFQGTVVGGLSGIDFDPANGRFVAISDDRSQLAPARFYTLRLDLSQFRRSAEPGRAGVAIEAVTTIRAVDGAAFAPNRVDPEAIRHAGGGRLFWSQEGGRSSAGLQPPGVAEMAADGRFVRAFALPAHYLPAGSVGGDEPADRGVRDNLAFEAMTLSPDGGTLWVATESALAQDGPEPTLAAGSPARLLSFDVASGRAGAEYVYELSPVPLPPNPPGGRAGNGLVEMLAIGERQFIAVERSYAAGAETPSPPGTRPSGVTVRLFLADAREATDVSALASVRGHAPTPVRKTLLLDLSTLKQDDGTPLVLDNVEGLGFGPPAGGRPTLVLVSDDNFSRRQFTQFIALSLTSPLTGPSPVSPPPR